jgi:3D (Asp-Asp-Asp) domain-containing protein
MKAILVLAATLAAAAAAAGAALADPPNKDTSINSFSFDDTSTCPGITISQHNEERDTTLELSATRLVIQRHGVATLSANGKTLTSNFSAKIFIDEPNVVRVVGTVYNIQVPGAGTVLLDAGNVAFDFETGATLYVHGPHQQFSGDVAGLCSYLAA